MKLEKEICYWCDEPTERAGRSDDSIYAEVLNFIGFHKAGDEIGPLCQPCYHSMVHLGIVAED